MDEDPREGVVRYFATVGGERIEIGQDPAKKEDPFKPLHTGREIDFWEAETWVRGTRYVAVSNASMKDAAKRLVARLPEDIREPDTTKTVTASDAVASGVAAGAKRKRRSP